MIIVHIPQKHINFDRTIASLYFMYLMNIIFLFFLNFFVSRIDFISINQKIIQLLIITEIQFTQFFKLMNNFVHLLILAEKLLKFLFDIIMTELTDQSLIDFISFIYFSYKYLH
jgi:hypothetical protein